jgi:transaldolase / glucose-6-phosphate isomerase
VTESKENTGRLLDVFKSQGSLPTVDPAFRENGTQLYADEKMLRMLSELCVQHNYTAGDLTSLLAAMINSTRAGDYFALQAYLPMHPQITGALEEIRRRLRHSSRRAVTIGFGPRFLHSTGQLHKGGPNNGNFIQITNEETEDVAIPGETFSFGVLQAAQAAGDMEALRSKDRRAVRLHISGDMIKGLEIILRAIDLVDARRK